MSVAPSKIITSFDTSLILAMADVDPGDTSTVEIEVPTSIAAYGHEPRLRPESTGNQATPRDERPVELIARAFAAGEQLLEMNDSELETLPIAKLRQIQRTVRSHNRPRYLERQPAQQS